MCYVSSIHNNQPLGKKILWGALNSLARHSGAGCAQPVTILVRVRFQNLLGFEPATKLRMVSVAPTNIKTPKRAFEYWLGSAGETRVEIMLDLQ